jgi:hypothetical protein
MFGSEPAPTPPPPALPDPLPSPPTYASGGRNRPAGNTNKVPGFGSTLLTSPSGVDSSTTNLARKSLLGQ